MDTSKICTKCKAQKPATEFNKRARNKLSSWCRACAVDNSKRWAKENPDRFYKTHRAGKDEIKRWFNTEVKVGPCTDCKGVFPPCCMDYDHRDGSVKHKNVATLVGEGYSRKSILEEVAKCDLVCANCHRIRTQSRGWNLWEKCKRKLTSRQSVRSRV